MAASWKTQFLLSCGGIPTSDSTCGDRFTSPVTVPQYSMLDENPIELLKDPDGYFIDKTGRAHNVALGPNKEESEEESIDYRTPQQTAVRVVSSSPFLINSNGRFINSNGETLPIFYISPNGKVVNNNGEVLEGFRVQHNAEILDQEGLPVCGVLADWNGIVLGTYPKVPNVAPKSAPKPFSALFRPAERFKEPVLIAQGRPQIREQDFHYPLYVSDDGALCDAEGRRIVVVDVSGRGGTLPRLSDPPTEQHERPKSHKDRQATIDGEYVRDITDAIMKYDKAVTERKRRLSRDIIDDAPIEDQQLIDVIVALCQSILKTGSSKEKERLKPLLDPIAHLHPFLQNLYDTLAHQKKSSADRAEGLMRRTTLSWLKSRPCPHIEALSPSQREQLYLDHGSRMCPTCSYDRGYIRTLKPLIGYRSDKPYQSPVKVPTGESVCPCCYGCRCFCPHHEPGTERVSMEFMAAPRRRVFEVAESIRAWEIDRYNEHEGRERKALIYLDENTKDIEALPRVPKVGMEGAKKKQPREFDEFRKMSMAAVFGVEEEGFYYKTSDTTQPLKDVPQWHEGCLVDSNIPAEYTAGVPLNVKILTIDDVIAKYYPQANYICTITIQVDNRIKTKELCEVSFKESFDRGDVELTARIQQAIWFKYKPGGKLWFTLLQRLDGVENTIGQTQRIGVDDPETLVPHSWPLVDSLSESQKATIYFWVDNEELRPQVDFQSVEVLRKEEGLTKPAVSLAKPLPTAAISPPGGAEPAEKPAKVSAPPSPSVVQPAKAVAPPSPSVAKLPPKPTEAGIAVTAPGVPKAPFKPAKTVAPLPVSLAKLPPTPPKVQPSPLKAFPGVAKPPSKLPMAAILPAAAPKPAPGPSTVEKKPFSLKLPPEKKPEGKHKEVPSKGELVKVVDQVPSEKLGTKVKAPSLEGEKLASPPPLKPKPKPEVKLLPSTDAKAPIIKSKPLKTTILETTLTTGTVSKASEKRVTPIQRKIPFEELISKKAAGKEIVEQKKMGESPKVSALKKIPPIKEDRKAEIPTPSTKPHKAVTKPKETKVPEVIKSPEIVPSVTTMKKPVLAKMQKAPVSEEASKQAIRTEGKLQAPDKIAAGDLKALTKLTLQPEALKKPPEKASKPVPAKDGKVAPSKGKAALPKSKTKAGKQWKEKAIPMKG